MMTLPKPTAADPRHAGALRFPIAAAPASLFAVVCLLLSVFGASGTNISFTFTNSAGQPDTNVFKIIPQGLTANSDGSFTTIGLPIRVTPAANGGATNFLMQGNYLATNAFLGQGIYFGGFPQDNGPTVYRAYDYQISGGNFFVTRVTGATATNITYNALTNALGYTPDPTNAALNATNPIPSWISASNATLQAALTATNTQIHTDIATSNAAERAAMILTNTATVARLDATNTQIHTDIATTNAAMQAALTATNTQIHTDIATTNAAMQAALTATNTQIHTDIATSNAAERAAMILTNTATLARLDATNTQIHTDIATTNLANLTATTNLVNSQAFLLSNRLAWLQFQVGGNTNYLVTTGFNPSTVNGTNVTGLAGGMTNLTAGSYATNDATGSWIYIGGSKMFGSTSGYYNGPWTNVGGTTAGTTSFLSNSLAAGANVTISSAFGVQTITSSGGGGGTNTLFLSSSNVTATTAGGSNLFYVPALTFDINGAATAATNAIYSAITNGYWATGNLSINSNNIFGRIQSGNAPFDISGSTNANASSINGTLLRGLATGILKNTTGTGAASIAAAGTDYQAPLTAAQLTGATLAATNTFGTNATVPLIAAGQLSVPTNYYIPNDSRVVTNNQVTAPFGTIKLSTALDDGSGNQLMDSAGALYNIGSTLLALSPQTYLMNDNSGTVSVDWKNRGLRGSWTSTNLTATGTFTGNGNALTNLNLAAATNETLRASNLLWSLEMTANTNLAGLLQSANYYNSNQIVFATGFTTTAANGPYFPISTNWYVNANGMWLFADASLNFYMSNPNAAPLGTNYSRGGGPVGSGWSVVNGAAPAGTTYYTNAPLPTAWLQQMTNIAQANYGGITGTLTNVTTITNTFISTTPASDHFVLSGAGTSDANTTWTYAGTIAAGVNPPNIYYTNAVNTSVVISNLINPGVSNYGLTNAGTTLCYYKSRAPLGNFAWVNVGGTLPVPVFGATTYSNFPVQFSRGPFLSPINTNNVNADVEQYGNDLLGTAGSFAFATINGVHTNAALYIPINNATPITINVGAGTYSNANPSMLFMGDNIIGNGRFSTILGYTNFVPQVFGATIPTGEGILTLPVNAGNNYIANLSCQLISMLGAGTNVFIENVEIGTTNTVDCFYASGFSFYNVTAVNSHFLGNWDVDYGVLNKTFRNCTWDMNDSTAVYTNSSGMHGSLVDSGNDTLTIIGGVMNITSSKTNGFYLGTGGNTNINAGIYVRSSVSSAATVPIRIYGLTVNRIFYATNNPVYAVYNLTNSNCYGYYWDSLNGAAPVLTFINGTNIWQPLNPANSMLTGNAGAATNLFLSTNLVTLAAGGTTSTNFAVGTLYTNAACRSLLVGGVVLQPAANQNVNITLNYTNAGMPFTALQWQAGGTGAVTNMQTFSVPLGTNATFKFTLTGTTGYLTNCVLWTE